MYKKERKRHVHESKDAGGETKSLETSVEAKEMERQTNVQNKTAEAIMDQEKESNAEEEREIAVQNETGEGRT